MQLDTPEIRKQLQDAIDHALALGASAAKIWLHDHNQLDCSFEAGKPKSCTSATRLSYSIETIVNGRMGCASGNDLPALGEMTRRAVGLAQTGSVAHFKQYPGAGSWVSVPSFDPVTANLTLAQLHDTACTVSNTLTSYDPDLFVEAGAGRSVHESLLLTSSGTCYHCRGSDWGIGGSVQRTVGTDMLFTGAWRGWRKKCELYDPKWITDRTIRDIEDGKTIVDSPKGRVKVLIPAEAVSMYLWALFMGTNGRNVAKGESPLKDKLGRQVLHENLTIIDDPHLAYCPGCGEIDSDGIASRQVTLFEKGVLRTFLYDWDTAHLAGAEPTGHNGCHPWSAYIVPGQYSEQDLLDAVGDGVLVKFLMGFGQGNIINGDFSCNIGLGYRVKDGRIVGRVKDTMLAGNLYDILSRPVLIGRDRDPVRRNPSIVLDGVSVTGK